MVKERGSERKRKHQGDKGESERERRHYRNECDERKQDIQV